MRTDGRFGVVIVSFNTCGLLRECLATVLPQDASQVVVADNGSTDGSCEMVARDFPGVLLDVDPSNPGYGAAANRGIRRCGDRNVLLLNSDTRLAPGALDGLQRYLLAHERAGVVGPRLRNPDGTIQRSTFPFPTPFRPPLKRDPFVGVIRWIPLMRERSLSTWSHSTDREVPYMTGAALAIRRRAFDAIGGFDESFFMYAEEVDLSWRMRAAGWETHFTPSAEVMHVGCASTGRYRARMLERSALSSLHFYRRHYSGARLVQAQITMRAGVGLRLLRDAARYLVATDLDHRHEMADNVRAWRRVLAHSTRDSVS